MLLDFFPVSDMSESFDEYIAWIDFTQEVDSLAVNGTWTSTLSDFLQLAVTNRSERTKKIFKSLSHRPI